MRATGLILTSFDQPAALAPFEIPGPADGQVLLAVKASSVNAFDGKVADGALRHAFQYDFPVTIGRDYAGVVAAVGDGVTRFRPGDAVFGYLGGPKLHRGAFATHLLVGEDECVVAKPDDLSFEQAACLPLSGVVALRCVAAAAPAEHEVVVVVGAPGGVGSYALQLAAARGATVVASGPAGDTDYLLGLGATEVVAPGVDFAAAVGKLHPDGVDALIDLVNGGDAVAELVELVKPGGRVVSVHRAADPALLEPRGIRGTNVMSNPDRALIEELGRLAAAGTLRVPIRETRPLADVAGALAEAKTRHTRGKTVITMN
ncbi:NADP-dependent oxidoreductase [Paractinoplanes globisporus]|uniref:NADP-dependent oxidoreductase n=1 Tax=Paractinoplanes globisporus TaxID=113565 RepID=A0ABW6W6S8_9ACTN|nr:zinc-binding dehydrogenase [Actinoplanes globisporus]